MVRRADGPVVGVGFAAGGSDNRRNLGARRESRNPHFHRFWGAPEGGNPWPAPFVLQVSQALVTATAVNMNERPPSILPRVTTSLTDLQLAIMRILWDRAESTVLEVQERLRPERDLAQTTIATLLSRLEKRGVVGHRLDGRQFVYHPLVSEQEVRRSMVSELTTLLFDGSPAALMSHLLGSRDMDPGDLDRVKRMIAEAEQGSRKERAGQGSGNDVR